MINDTVEINRSPAEVFAYLDQLDRPGEWQSQIVSVQVETEGPTRVGSRAREGRNIQGREQEMTYEVTEHDAPRRVAFRGIDGPIRPIGTVTVQPLDDGSRSRLTLEFDLKGHGFGVLIAPFARRMARKQIPQDQAMLKERLESGV